MDFPEVVSAIKPAVAAIGIRHTGQDASFRQYVDEAESPTLPELLGTGFCIHQRGIIVTCQHVVDTLSNIIRKKSIPTASAVVVFTSYDRNGRAYLDGIPVNRILAPGDDIGLIELRPHSSPLPTIAAGEDFNVDVGEEIGICGFPLGENPLQADGRLAGGASFVQKGIISAILPSEFAGNRKEFVIGAPVYPGYVGSPIFRTKKPELVGIVKAIASPTIRVAEQEIDVPVQNTAYAIPGRMMTNAIDVGIQALLKKRGR